jgi:hypothetical protein
MANVAVLLSPTAGVEGTPIVPAVTTVILDVAFGIFGVKVLAVITVDPKLFAATWTVALVDPCAIVTVAGTVATAVLLETRLKVRPPAGAAAERLSGRLRVARPVMVALLWPKAIVALTCTVALALVMPVPDALIFAEPRLTPVMVGCVAGAVWPAKMVIVAGETVSFVVSLLASAIVKSVGAALARVTGKVTVAPKPTAGAEGRVKLTGDVTVTLAVESAMFGSLLAWITADPGATGVTGTWTEVCPCANVTVAGTDAAAAFDEVKLTVIPPAGAAADSASVTFCEPVPTTMLRFWAKLMVALTWTGAVPAE